MSMKLCVHINADAGFQFNCDVVIPDGYLLDPASHQWFIEFCKIGGLLCDVILQVVDSLYLFVPCGGIDGCFLAKFSESEDFICYFVVIHITIDTSFLKWHIAVGFNIDAKCFHEIVLSTKQAAEKSLPPAVLLFIFIGFVFIDVTADVVYRIADKIENNFPYVINDEAIDRYKKGVCDDISNK